jgi:hypothetical protein
MASWIPKVRSRVKTEDIKGQNLSLVELAFMIQAFFRVAELDNPEADYTMDWIAQTNNEWLRQKPLRDGDVVTLRNVIMLRRSEKIIELVAVLRKTDDTYDIAEGLWRDEG